MTAPMISFEGVGKVFPVYHHITGGMKNFVVRLPQALKSLRKSRYEALSEISFSVPAGESIGIIGPNGAGKSTILGLIAGVLRPSSGRVRVRERVSPLLELGSGFHTELTGRENIELNAVLLGLSRKKALAKQDSIAEWAELQDRIDQPVRTYSSGMVMRLAFSVVAHLDPKILVLDEVIAVGDASFQRKCMNKMQSFKAGGVTIVLVSHSMEQVKELCDRAIWIDRTGIRRIGPAEEVTREYEDSS